MLKINLKQVHIIHWLILAVLTGPVVSCTGNGKKLPDESNQNATTVSDAIGLVENEKDSLTTQYPVTKDGTTWPEDIPPDIPLLDEYGQIVRYRQTTMENSVTFEMFFEGLTVEGLNRYESDLLSHGFRTKKNVQGNERVLAAEKDKTFVNIRVGKEPVSTVTVVIFQ